MQAGYTHIAEAKMTDTRSTTSGKDQDQLQAFVVEQLRSGVDRNSIVTKLTDNMGVNNSDATQIVTLTYAKLRKTADEEEFSFGMLLPALIGGLVAAVVGGIIWGMVVITTDYEIGYMAVGIGFLTGYGVVLFTSGRKGVPLQVIAVAASIVGIAIGKYVTFFQAVKGYVSQEYGPDATAQLSMVSTGIVQAFAESLGEILGGYDILWVILAVVTAWKIPKAQGVKLSG